MVKFLCSKRTMPPVLKTTENFNLLETLLTLHYGYVVICFEIIILFFIFRFICDKCHERRGTKRIENKYSAKRLPTTRLGSYIETRVNNFLRKKEAESGEVYIRVVYTGDKQVEVKSGMKRRLVFYNFC